MERPARSHEALFGLVALLLVAAGTLVRIVYARRFQGWGAAPDQLAWELLLEEGRRTGFRYDQLIHYPHEGGSVLLSLLSLLLAPLARAFGSFPPLVWAALVFDTAARFLTIHVARRTFGIGAGFAFALFSVFSLPLLLPWSALSFGLHAASAVWPILFLLFAERGLASTRSAALLGLFLGIAVVFSYDNLSLLPVAFVLLAIQSRKPGGGRIALSALLGCAVVLTAHIVVRLTVPHGFALESLGAFSVRDLDFIPAQPGETWVAWKRVFSHTLPGATQLPRLLETGKEEVRAGFVLLSFVGVLLATLARPASCPPARSRAAALGTLVLLTWLSLYAASPLFEPRRDLDDFISYRHLAFVLPLLSLLALAGFTSRRGLRQVGAILLIGASIGGGVHAVQSVRKTEPADIATGWVVSRKLGHDPARLVRLLEVVDPAKKKDLAFGYGWGYASVLFETSGMPATERVERLARIVALFPEDVRGATREGIRFAFGPGITPRLDPRLMKAIESRLEPVRALPAAAPSGE